jgi:hypothetical protein
MVTTKTRNYEVVQDINMEHYISQDNIGLISHFYQKGEIIRGQLLPENKIRVNAIYIANDKPYSTPLFFEPEMLQETDKERPRTKKTILGKLSHNINEMEPLHRIIMFILLAGIVYALFKKYNK